MPTGTPTPFAGLNQWQFDDKPKMEDFNADNQKTDSAIGALQTELAGKAGMADLNAKADRAELAAKASLAELAAKADRSELAAKANLTDLSGKADKIELSALSAAKADAETVEALTERVEALEQNGVPGGGTGPNPGTLPTQSQIRVVAGNESAEVYIENRDGVNYAGTKLVCKASGAMPQDETDGLVADACLNPVQTIGGLTNDQLYTVRAFAYNQLGQAQTSVDGAIASFIPLEEYPLSGLPIGSAVNIGVDGVQREFIVVHQGLPSTMYDASFENGTILLMKDVFENRQWHTSDRNDYQNSAVHTWLNGTFLNLIEEGIRNQIKQVRIPFRAGSGNSSTVSQGSSGLQASVFLLSGYEVGSGTAFYPGDGAVLNYFAGINTMDANVKRVAYLNGIVATWWLRSPYFYSSNTLTQARLVNTNGAPNSSVGTSASYGVRPALVLLNAIRAKKVANSNGVYNLML